MWWLLGALCVLLLLLLVLFCRFQNNALVTTVLRVPGKNTENAPVRAVQISDLHSKRFGRGNCRLIEAVQAAAPDILLVTGDTFDDSGARREEMLSFLRGCAAIAPVLFIGGNHERRLPDREALLKSLGQIPNLTVLDNAAVTLDVNGRAVSVLGLDENQGSYDAYRERARGNYKYRDFSKLFGELENRPGLRLVLSHYPENFALIGEKSYQNHTFDVMFSGHAHGGQFRLPLIGGLYAPGQGLFPRYTAGLHGTGPYLIVSRGLGPSSFYLRLFNRPELVVAEFGYAGDPPNHKK